MMLFIVPLAQRRSENGEACEKFGEAERGPAPPTRQELSPEQRYPGIAAQTRVSDCAGRSIGRAQICHDRTAGMSGAHASPERYDA
ncbi:MAG TPA: hypothetical protein VL966_12365 [Alphaproteobacteria bacterium]|nr:hypothetical protein [Alphaproteobacteria bacterium]